MREKDRTFRGCGGAMRTCDANTYEHDEHGGGPQEGKQADRRQNAER